MYYSFNSYVGTNIKFREYNKTSCVIVLKYIIKSPVTEYKRWLNFYISICDKNLDKQLKKFT